MRWLSVHHRDDRTQYHPRSSPPAGPRRPPPAEPTGVTTRPTRRPSPRPTRSPPTETHTPTGSPPPAPPRAHAPHEGASTIGHLSILHLGQSLHRTRGGSGRARLPEVS